MKITLAAVVLTAIGLLAPAALWAAAGDGDALPAGGGEPGKALLAFLDAAHRKDFASIRALYPGEALNKVTDKELEGYFGMFVLFDPATLRITGGILKGDSATLTTASQGTIVMRRTNGKWLMEQWGAHAEASAEVDVRAEVTLGKGAAATPKADNPLQPANSPEPETTPEPGEPAQPAGLVEKNDGPGLATFTFDPGSLQVLPEEEKGGQVVITTGTGEEKVLFHHVNSYEEAANAAAVLRHCGINEVLEVSMPGEIENIYLKSGQAPSGNHAGEKCTTFDPSALAVTEFTGRLSSESGPGEIYTQWSLEDGTRTVTRFNLKPFAEGLASILKKYGFTHHCQVGTFRYYRR